MSKRSLLKGKAAHPAMYYAEEFKAIGIAEICLGVTSLVFELVNVIYYGLATHHKFQMWAAGIWCGIWFIVTGCLALASWRKPIQCTIIAGLVASVFAMMAAIYLFFFEIKMAHWIDHATSGFALTALFHSFLVLVAIAVFVVCIIHLVYASRAAVAKAKEPDESDDDDIVTED